MEPIIERLFPFRSPSRCGSRSLAWLTHTRTAEGMSVARVRHEVNTQRTDVANGSR